MWTRFYPSPEVNCNSLPKLHTFVDPCSASGTRIRQLGGAERLRGAAARLARQWPASQISEIGDDRTEGMAIVRAAVQRFGVQHELPLLGGERRANGDLAGRTRTPRPIHSTSGACNDLNRALARAGVGPDGESAARSSSAPQRFSSPMLPSILRRMCNG
jgi:hypothetical protein